MRPKTSTYLLFITILSCIYLFYAIFLQFTITITIDLMLYTESLIHLIYKCIFAAVYSPQHLSRLVNY